MSDANASKSTAKTNSSAGTDKVGHWMYWHYLVILGLVGFAVFMSIERPFGAYVTWLIMMVAIAAFLAVTGHGIKKMWRGALVNEYNRISLSRLQMLSWTTMVVAALGVLGVRRISLDPLAGLALTVPPEIWMVMGISTTSLLFSPAIQQRQANAKKPTNGGKKGKGQDGDTADVPSGGQLVVKDKIGDARWSDLFMSEMVDSRGYLDIAKVQMFLFTVLTLITYGVAIGATLKTSPLPGALPELGQGLLTLLGISHGGYLAGKITSPGGGGGDGDDNA